MGGRPVGSVDTSGYSGNEAEPQTKVVGGFATAFAVAPDSVVTELAGILSGSTEQPERHVWRFNVANEDGTTDYGIITIYDRGDGYYDAQGFVFRDPSTFGSLEPAAVAFRQQVDDLLDAWDSGDGWNAFRFGAYEFGETSTTDLFGVTDALYVVQRLQGARFAQAFESVAFLAGGGGSTNGVRSGRTSLRSGRRGADWSEYGETIGASRNEAPPAPGSLSDLAARSWYKKQLAAIPGKIDPSLPLKQRALQAFKMRNELKMSARDLMYNREAAGALPPPRTLEDVIGRAIRKGGARTPDEIWTYVLHGSQRTNKAVDNKVGL